MAHHFRKVADFSAELDHQAFVIHGLVILGFAPVLEVPQKTLRTIRLLLEDRLDTGQVLVEVNVE
ncbi:hypothetical protein D3C77_659620 [compost metagenome]